MLTRPNPLKYLIFFMALATAMFNCSCGHYAKQKVELPRVETRGTLGLDKDAIDSTSLQLSHTNQANALERVLRSKLDQYLKLNDAENPSLCISKIKIKHPRPITSRADVIFSLLSTPIIVPFSFIPSKLYIYLTIEYEISNHNGEVVYKNELAEIVRGSFSGWSFTRYLGRKRLFEQSGTVIGDCVANAVIEDILKNYSTIAMLDKVHLGNPKYVTTQTSKSFNTQPKVIETILPSCKSQKRHAIGVIVGNKNYSKTSQDIPDVNYAHNDANIMYQYLTKTLGYMEGNIIFIEDATQADLIATFGSQGNPNGQLSDWVREGKSDVFIYYSGHGAPDLKTGKGYLVPVDSNPNKIDLNGYPLETLYCNLEKLSAKSVTIVIDACFSGGSSTGSIVNNASSIALKLATPPKNKSNLTILTATDISEIASWDNEAMFGLFTKHFIDGISGKADSADFGNNDQKVTLEELKRYLQEEVSYMARRIYGREQHPQIIGPSRLVLSEISSN